MKRPVQVAGAVVTGGLLFWPAHADRPAADALGPVLGQLTASSMELRSAVKTDGRPAQQRLRLLAQYTEEADGGTEDSGEGESADETPSTQGAINDGSSGTFESGSEYSASDDPFMAGSSSDPLESSDTANEVPGSDEPKPQPADWAPEQGVTAAEAGGDDSRMKFKVSTGFDYSSGDYGTDETTNILFIPVSGQLDTRSWRFKVTVPWLRIDGLQSVVGSTGGGEDTDPANTAVDERSGLGDVVGSVTYKLPPLGENAPFIDLTGKVKFPTASRDDFLGTGEFDFTGQADIFQAFGDLTLFGTIGYRVLGDPDDRELNNGLLAGGGVAYKFSDSVSGGGILDWKEAAADGNEDPFEVVPYMVFKFHEDWAVQAYGVFGLSDGSPDAGGGLQISVTFD